MKTLVPPNSELCRAEYSATLVQAPDGPLSVFIVAQGMHSTSGYEVFFRQSPPDVYPPEFSLWHIRPEVGADVVTPFTKFASFDVRGRTEKIVVTDASGPHEIPVKPLSRDLEHK